MKQKIRLFVCAFALLTVTSKANDICEDLYGRHQLYHQLKLYDQPGVFAGKYSPPQLIEIELRRDGTVIEDWHYLDDEVMRIEFYRSAPEHSLTNNNVGRVVMSCCDSKESCDEIRSRAKGTIENLRQFPEYLGDVDHRERVLACMESQLKKVAESFE